MIIKNRVKAIDFGKGISVLMLATVHTLWTYGDMHTQENTLVGQVIHFLGKGTPIFLISMGFTLPLSRYQSSTALLMRGFVVLKQGYIMNFLKFIVPILLGFMPVAFITAYGVEEPIPASFLFYLLQTGDILQLAGVSLLLLTAIYKYSLSNKYIPLILGILILSVSQEVRGLRVNVAGIDYLLDLLWGGEWNVYFAVFPWFSFILIGLFFGLWFREAGEDTSFIFKQMLFTGLVALILGGALCFYNFEYHFGDYFHLGPGGTVYLAGINLVVLWLINLLVSNIKHNRVLDFLYYSSRHVTKLYVTQWVLICWGMGIVGLREMNGTEVLITIPIMTGLTYLVHAQIEKITSWSRRQRSKLMSRFKLRVKTR